MREDSILEEVRAAREAFSWAHANDPRAMVDALRSLDERGDRTVVRFARRPPSEPVAPHAHPVVIVPADSRLAPS
jgi:hypothetical protein